MHGVGRLLCELLASTARDGQQALPPHVSDSAAVHLLYQPVQRRVRSASYRYPAGITRRRRRQVV